MPSENLNLDDITEARRKSLEETIHPITAEEMKTLGEMLFPQADHPWRERFMAFMTENAGATFHHATTHDRIHILYCAAQDKGMWFMPGSGTGPLQGKGRKIMKELIGEN